MLISVMAVLMIGIGAGFALMGAWLVLPFSGAELLLLIWALACSMRNSGFREVITISDNTIRIERGTSYPQQRYEFLRAWARVQWSSPAVRGSLARLLLGSHGRQVEIGAFLNEEEKQILAKELQKLLG
ncbi:MAG: hypothetical protein AXA67_08970 [Methylothermaceae bacteria B42]|nr:MAG: hypothetical protein AXA67_08970 [Methylothermaceae bacteria B42]